LSRSLLWNLWREFSDPDLEVLRKAGVCECLGELMKDAAVGDPERLEPRDCGVPMPLRELGQLG